MAKGSPQHLALAPARMQAWVVALLTLINDAQDIGSVLGAGEPFDTSAALLGADNTLLLAVDVFDARATQARLVEKRAHVAQHKPAEYWQLVCAAKPKAHLLQRDARGKFHPTPADKSGLHFSLAHEAFSFPSAWFAEQPRLLEMMEHWGLIDVDG